MPWKIENTGGSEPFAVVNSNTGKVAGKHPTKKEAKKQLAALYNNVPDAKKK